MPNTPLRAQRRVRVASLLLAQTTQNFTLGALALLLPLVRDDIPMSFTQAGALSVVASVTYAVMQVPAGYLGDRFGARRVLIIGLLGLNAMTVLLATATSYLALALILTVIGVFRSLAFTPGLRLMTAEFGVERRATAMSTFMSAGFVSNLILSLVAPPLAGPLGWRGILILFAVLSLIPVVVYAAVASNGPDTIGDHEDRPSFRELRSYLVERVIWLTSLIQFVRLAAVMSLRFWLPSYLVADKGLSLSSAGLIVALSSVVSIFTPTIGGLISDRLGRPLLVIGVCLAVLAVCFVLLAAASSIGLIVVVVAVQAVVIQAYSGSLFDVPLLHFGERAAGSLNGFGNFWANVGGLTTTYILGVSKDATGSFDLGWYLLGGMCAVALVATLLTPVPRHPQRSYPTPSTMEAT